MSFSVFYAVRFSPAPELGEWLNVAVVGEGITERKAGLVVTKELKRIEAAFGPDSVERVKAICLDLAGLVEAMAKSHELGEETQSIPTAMRDQALSVSFSEQIAVFDGSFMSALAEIAQKYLDFDDAGSEQAHMPKLSTQETADDSQKVPATQLSQLAKSLQKKLKDIVPVPPVEEHASADPNHDMNSILVIADAAHTALSEVVEALKQANRKPEPPPIIEPEQSSTVAAVHIEQTSEIEWERLASEPTHIDPPKMSKQQIKPEQR